MTSIDRSQASQVSPLQHVNLAQGPKKKPAFDPVKAAQNQQLTQNRGPDPFAEAIREASDGDSDEGALRSALGMADDDRKSKSPSEESRDKKQDGVAGAQAADLAERSLEKGSQVDAALRARQQAILGDTAASESSKGIATVSAVEMSSEAISERHEELMLLSGSMEREQTATHIAQEAADGVSAIQKTNFWQKSEVQKDWLTAAQMVAVR